MLDVDHVSKTYPTPRGPLTVLADVSFSLASGDVAAITGPSGSGKSSLLYLLGALETPSSGRVRVDGQDPFALSGADVAAFRNRAIGFVFQDHHLLPQLTVLENVLLPTLVNPEAKLSDVEKCAQALLERVGLSGRIEHLPAELSGGERQRVAVARALIQRPILLLADEPTGSLDRKNAVAIGELLLELHRHEQNILVVVTHSPDLANTFPRTAEMIDGTLTG